MKLVFNIFTLFSFQGLSANQAANKLRELRSTPTAHEIATYIKRARAQTRLQDQDESVQGARGTVRGAARYSKDAKKQKLDQTRNRDFKRSATPRTERIREKQKEYKRSGKKLSENKSSATPRTERNGKKQSENKRSATPRTERNGEKEKNPREKKKTDFPCNLPLNFFLLLQTLKFIDAPPPFKGRLPPVMFPISDACLSCIMQKITKGLAISLPEYRTIVMETTSCASYVKYYQWAVRTMTLTAFHRILSFIIENPNAPLSKFPPFQPSFTQIINEHPTTGSLFTKNYELNAQIHSLLGKIPSSHAIFLDNVPIEVPEINCIH